MLSVIHFDDNPFELESVKKSLEHSTLSRQFKVQSVQNLKEVRKTFHQNVLFDLAILDIRNGESGNNDGYLVAKELRTLNPKTVIIMRSELSDPAAIRDSFAAGADDFISKNSIEEELALRVTHSYDLAKLKRGLKPISKPSNYTDAFSINIASETMNRIYQRIPKILDSAVGAVHIAGEPGTGKEVVADLFREALGSSVPFIKVNCGAITPSLMESELFGHTKGAFTGALNDRKGLIEAASGGWIFFDEVGTLTPSAQVALLRVLENKEIKPVGSAKTLLVDIRVISATNESLPTLVSQGKFRRDLWQRLEEVLITLPPLRERQDEMGQLIDYFCQTMHNGPYKITKPAKDLLQTFSWADGNIRQLRNCLRAMTEFQTDKVLTPLSIPRSFFGVSDAQIQSPVAAPLSEQAHDLIELIPIPWDPKAPQPYAKASDLLLLAILIRLAKKNPRLSIRAAAQLTGVSKTTLTDRLRLIFEQKSVESAIVAQIFGLTW